MRGEREDMRVKNWRNESNEKNGNKKLDIDISLRRFSTVSTARHNICSFSLFFRPNIRDTTKCCSSLGAREGWFQTKIVAEIVTRSRFGRWRVRELPAEISGVARTEDYQSTVLASPDISAGNNRIHLLPNRLLVTKKPRTVIRRTLTHTHQIF